MTETSPKQDFNNKNQKIIQQADLPLACPLPEMSLWNAHPRVYLPVEKTGQVTCPYCGTQYVLKDFEGNFEEDHEIKEDDRPQANHKPGGNHE